MFTSLLLNVEKFNKNCTWNRTKKTTTAAAAFTASNNLGLPLKVLTERPFAEPCNQVTAWQKTQTCSSTFQDNRPRTVLVSRKHLLFGRDTSHLAERPKKARRVLHLTKTNYERHFDWLTECCEKKMVNLRDVDKCKSGRTWHPNSSTATCLFCHFFIHRILFQTSNTSGDSVS